MKNIEKMITVRLQEIKRKLVKNINVINILY